AKKYFVLSILLTAIFAATTRAFISVWARQTRTIGSMLNGPAGRRNDLQAERPIDSLFYGKAMADKPPRRQVYLIVAAITLIAVGFIFYRMKRVEERHQELNLQNVEPQVAAKIQRL